MIPNTFGLLGCCMPWCTDILADETFVYIKNKTTANKATTITNTKARNEDLGLISTESQPPAFLEEPWLF